MKKTVFSYRRACRIARILREGGRQIRPARRARLSELAAAARQPEPRDDELRPFGQDGLYA
jgi:hypothetical protein